MGGGLKSFSCQTKLFYWWSWDCDNFQVALIVVIVVIVVIIIVCIISLIVVDKAHLALLETAVEFCG